MLQDRRDPPPPNGHGPPLPLWCGGMVVVNHYAPERLHEQI